MKNLNEDMLLGRTPEEDDAETQLTEDVLKSTNESRDRVTKLLQEAESKKKQAMKESVGLIYGQMVEEAKSKTLDNAGVMQIKHLNTDGHIAEIVHEGKTFKVGTEKFVTMIKGYVSELVKENRKLKTVVVEQGNELRRISAKIQLMESRQNASPYIETDDTLLKEVRELKSKIKQLEVKADER